MQALLDVILPVFLVVGFGYIVAWRKVMTAPQVDGLMKYAQGIAAPVLLFTAISRLDLGASFDPRLLAAFYAGAGSGFALGFSVARYGFGRDTEDSIVAGFAGLFSNSLLMGLAVTEQAYGPDALSANFAIISVHSPFCYGLGITAMEITRARGRPAQQIPGIVLKAMFSNVLIIGITLGFIVNLTGLVQPQALLVATDYIARSTLPAALFGMGAVLYRYEIKGDLRLALALCAISLLVHPAITFSLGTAFALPPEAFRSAVITAAMAPGVNAYIFASLYGRAERVAASAVLMGTALCLVTAAVWLSFLP